MSRNNSTRTFGVMFFLLLMLALSISTACTRTVTKEVPVEVVVEKEVIKEVPVEVVVEKEVIKEVEVPVEVVVEKEVIKEVPVEVVVEKEVIVEVTKEVPVEVVVEEEVIKEVEVPVEVIREVVVEKEVVVTATPLPTPVPTATPVAPRKPTGRIAFASKRDENAEIYIMNADGSELQRLTKNDSYDYVSDCSDDGNRLLLTVWDTTYARWDLDAITADGARAGAPRSDNLIFHYVLGDWSPDGSRLAYQSTQANSNNQGWHLFVTSFVAGRPNRVTPGDLKLDLGRKPRWSPDGGDIVYSKTVDGNREIYRFDLSKSEETRLTNNSSLDSNPDWSPDGERIVFRSERDGNSEIYVMNADGSSATRLTNRSEEDKIPLWSPDGNWISFHSTGDEGTDLYVMKSDGTDVVQLTHDGETADWGSAWCPE